jgi:hypothetical protein
METVINNNRKVYAIQKEFNTLFPKLKIQFYAKPANPNGEHSPKLITKSSKSLKDCRAIHEEGIIEILPSMTIAELKSRFSDTYGLFIEINHMSTDGTEQNPVDESLTLGENNEH